MKPKRIIRNGFRVGEFFKYKSKVEAIERKLTPRYLKNSERGG
jgi:hypothetical protein